MADRGDNGDRHLFWFLMLVAVALTAMVLVSEGMR